MPVFPGRFLFPAAKTVDAVIDSFVKTITSLHEIDNVQNCEAARLTGVIEQAAVERDMALMEARRARDIAGKLEALIS